ncbi:MAG: S9 family peptidase [Bacteroidales bacterium]
MKKTFLLLTLTFLAIMISAQENNNFYTPELLWKLGRVSDVQISENNKTIIYGVSWYNLKENTGNRDLYTVDIDGNNLKKVTDFKGSESNGIFHKNFIYFLSGKNGKSQIWRASADGSNPVQISNTDHDISGFSISPDGKKILFIQRIKLDETPNDIHPDLPKANARIENDLMYRHWDSWSDYSYNHIFVADFNVDKIGEATDIMLNQKFDAPMKPWGGMEQIAWHPNGNKIAYTCKKLNGKEYSESTNSEIYLYDLQTNTETVLSKGLMGYDHDPVFSHDGNKIVWRSMERDGFEADKDRIMIHDFTTGRTTNYSENFDNNASSFVWSADDKYIYFISPNKGCEHIFKLDVANKTFKQITTDQYDYLSILLCGNDIITTKQSMLEPTEIYRISENGKQTKISKTNDEILKDVASASVEKRWITTTDGKQMLTWIILPPNFDANKKYPTLLYCQGGPQSMVSQFFSYRWNFQMMAANGYIVVAPNRRGVPGFGQEWNDQISGDYGGQNMKDYLVAIDEMAKKPYVDENRLGAIGASYGGFSVFWLAGNHDKRFKAFISHCGMFNLEQQYLATEEMWFVNWDLGGAYWENNDKVKHSYANSPHKFVHKWDTPILIIEGENDFRIPYTQGIAAFNAAILNNVPAKYLHFPEESHWVLRPQNSVMWQREFYNWLDMWLK